MLFSANMVLPISVSDIAISICRAAIEKYLIEGERLKPANLPEIFNKKIPVFVSLKKGNQTRGCAGTFHRDKSLAENLVEFSIIAATQDFRHRPIDRNELKDIKIQITIPGEITEIPSINFYNPEIEGFFVEKDSKIGIVLPKEAKTSHYALKIALRNAGLQNVNEVRLFKFKAQIFIEEER